MSGLKKRGVGRGEDILTDEEEREKEGRKKGKESRTEGGWKKEGWEKKGGWREEGRK